MPLEYDGERPDIHEEAYVAPNARIRSNVMIGMKLLAYCLEKASDLENFFFAILIEGNRDSMALLERFDFEQWGFLPEVVRHKGEKRGQYYMGKILEKIS